MCIIEILRKREKRMTTLTIRKTANAVCINIPKKY